MAFLHICWRFLSIPDISFAEMTKATRSDMVTRLKMRISEISTQNNTRKTENYVMSSGKKLKNLVT